MTTSVAMSFGTPLALPFGHARPKAPLSLVQRKVSHSWLRHATATRPDEQGCWSIPIEDMAKQTGFDLNDEHCLRDCALELMSIVFEWEVAAAGGKRPKWKATVLFPDIEITSEAVRYRVSAAIASPAAIPRAKPEACTREPSEEAA